MSNPHVLKVRRGLQGPSVFHTPLSDYSEHADTYPEEFDNKRRHVEFIHQ